VELFSDEASRLELAAEVEPWLLARALEASSVGQAALEALEEAVGEFARSDPSTAPTVLARPVLEHFRDVTRLLGSPLPVARRQRLAVVAGHLAGLAGSLAFDLRDLHLLCRVTPHRNGGRWLGGVGLGRSLGGFGLGSPRASEGKPFLASLLALPRQPSPRGRPALGG
jgi:hypothetical protein